MKIFLKQGLFPLHDMNVLFLLITTDSHNKVATIKLRRGYVNKLVQGKLGYEPSGYITCAVVMPCKCFCPMVNQKQLILIQRAVERISAPLPASPLVLNRCGQKLYETKSWQELQIKILPLARSEYQPCLQHCKPYHGLQ